MSAKEFDDWLAYNELEPFGQARHELFHAQFFAMWANAHKKKGASSVRPKNFVLDFTPKPKVSNAELMRNQDMLFRALGG